MGGWTGIWQWVVVLAIVLLLFGGRGKISALMGDFGKGLKSFKKGMKDGEVTAGEEPPILKTEAPPKVVDATVEKKDETENG